MSRMTGPGGHRKSRGFTLVEVLVASLIVLIVLGVLAHAARTFFSGQKRISERQVCLGLARAEIAMIDRDGMIPDDGTYRHDETIMGRTYTVMTEVGSGPDGQCPFTEVIARASSDMVAGAEVELIRRYYR